jgi:hypothetical protein
MAALAWSLGPGPVRGAGSAPSLRSVAAASDSVFMAANAVRLLWAISLAPFPRSARYGSTVTR